jgi:hypothetical protein
MKYLITIIITALALNMYSQTIELELVSTAGENFKNSKIELCWSIGEVITETYSNQTNFISQGFHQSKFEIINLIDDLSPEVQVKIYPNPTFGGVTMQFNNEDIQGLSYKVVDLNGRILYANSINSNIEQLDLNNCSQGIYLLYIFSTSKKINSVYKLRKIN